MAFDPSQQRYIMGHFATGITIVTTRVDDVRSGLTANAFASLSLNPPLVMVAIDRSGHSYEFLKRAGCFAVNFLRADQEHLSRRFATPGPKDFSDLTIKEEVTGAPILADALGWVDCRVYDVATGGDHDVFIGEIVAGVAEEAEPLLYYRGKYRRLAPL